VLETPHVIVGAAIATNVANPLVSLPLAFFSHFVLERVPHWNPHLNTELKTHGKISKQTKMVVFFDSTLALTSGVIIASLALPDINRFFIIIFACFLSVLPDVIEAPYFFLNKKGKFFDFWIKFQKSIQVDTAAFPGLTTQFLTILAALYWIFF
jgi:hypothetical protein